MKQHIVKLSAAQQQGLQAMLRKGKENARVLMRAHVLLKSHEGRTDVIIADLLSITVRTVSRIRARFAGGGLKRALYDAPRPGATPIFSTQTEARLIAIACSAPPEGRATWTLELLQKRLKKDKVVKDVSTVTIWTRLKKNDLKPWLKKKCGVSQNSRRNFGNAWRISLRSMNNHTFPRPPWSVWMKKAFNSSPTQDILWP